MSNTKTYFTEAFRQLREVFLCFFSRIRQKNNSLPSRCINEINAIITYFPEEERNLLPLTLVEYFDEHATQSPNDALDMTKPLEKQSLSDETIVFLYYINSIFAEIKKCDADTEDELHSAHIRATRTFIKMLNGKDDIPLHN